MCDLARESDIDTLLPAVSITGPDGPVTVQAIEEVKSQHDDGVSTWESVEGFRIRFAPQATEGEYTVRIAPNVADISKNRLDGSDEDHRVANLRMLTEVRSESCRSKCLEQSTSTATY